MSCTTLFWKKYEHPSFFFSFKHPKSWQVVEESSFQTQLSILLSVDDPIFKPNINFVIQPLSKLSLEQLSYLANKQLIKLLSGFEQLSQTEIIVSGFTAIELRSKYEALNDPRIIRTSIFKTQDLEYTITFTCRQSQEEQLLQNYLKFIKTLKVPKSVASIRK
ncbi:MAG TPA: PsbP-related protein [Oligoflexia bacterium]|nr:PsbP-related protein [Oligoflexia bacterium]HMR23924.1 PsbP-related protein [Oligoflexia bacterium]